MVVNEQTHAIKTFKKEKESKKSECYEEVEVDEPYVNVFFYVFMRVKWEQRSKKKRKEIERMAQTG